MDFSSVWFLERLRAIPLSFSSVALRRVGGGGGGGGFEGFERTPFEDQ